MPELGLVLLLAAVPPIGVVPGAAVAELREARRIGIHHTIVLMDGRWWLGEPKTAKSRRAIEITAPTLDLLRNHWAAQAKRLLATGHRMTDDYLVFCDADDAARRDPRPEGDAAPCTSRDKGSHEGSTAGAEANEGLDPSVVVDRANEGEFGTAYRMRGITVSCDPIWVA